MPVYTPDSTAAPLPCGTLAFGGSDERTGMGREEITMYGSIIRRFGQAGIVLVALSYGVSSRAESLADFYRNKTITFVQASAAGGGYATTTELLIKYLPAAIPGHPKVQIQFMPG